MNLIIRFVFLVILYQEVVSSLNVTNIQPNFTKFQSNVTEIQRNVTEIQTNVTNILKYTEPKIVGGTEANFNGIEHIVSIRLRRTDSYKFGSGHICGGILLNSTTIITAAHCFLNLQYNPPQLRRASEFKVVMGTLDKSRRTFNTFESDIKKIVIHRNFSFQTMENDIGLMIMMKSVPKYNPFIKTIQLAKTLPPSGTKCRIDGWGALYSGSQGSNRLRTASITIIDKKKCFQSYGYKLKNGMFCAGNWFGGQDSCQGDSGGPLTCNGKLVGVVSWGDKCGLPYLPGIYSDIAYFEHWIRTARSNSTKLFIEYKIYFIIFLIIGQIFV